MNPPAQVQPLVRLVGWLDALWRAGVAVSRRDLEDGWLDAQKGSW